MNIIKFYTILLFTITSLASSVIFKRDDTTIENEEIASEECAIELKNSDLGRCMPKIDLSNYKRKCEDMYSEKCQRFYESDLTKQFPICSKNSMFKEFIQPIVFKQVINSLSFKCFFDEKGNLCPYSLHVLTHTGGEMAIDDTCYSEKCTDDLVERAKRFNLESIGAIENLSFMEEKFSYQEIKAIDLMISKLESDECKSRHIMTSNAYTVKVNSILLMASLLLLILFY
ncbi:hypothetical protein BCR36DRAFT_587039 [Piromyces finnis]|uniref:Uncharacterized protein n=1 Tax=Piromyces finnis TaxID=1754191 RepID=A0A1Y1UXD5_9FUNG|nr:hypothetical protein BCR36DRAFT_587039 [Piromyces finnis]|eukprot:ORX42768.1 hypothetical protein BCR36DRAFT_587039 [Piromyces finnis]